MTVLEPVDLSAAQKRDARTIRRQCPGLQPRLPGSIRRAWQLVGINATGLTLDVRGTVRRVPFAHLDKLTVCRTHTLALCQETSFSSKANGRSARWVKLANGEIVTVAAIAADGASA
jgi:hypothetical protein